MPTTVSYSDARARLAELWDEAADSREPITLTRRGKEGASRTWPSPNSAMTTRKGP